MAGTVNIVQLRSTVFLRQNIFYTPDNAESFKKLLIPDGHEFGFPAGTQFNGVNPRIPQYGMPWRLAKKTDKGEYNVIFQMGKVDIVLNTDIPYDSVAEKEFCNKSLEWFAKIIDALGADSVALRVAYAPLYAVFKDDESFENQFWTVFFKNTSINGVLMKDINLAFTLKSYLTVNNEEVLLNLFHNIYDGNRHENNVSQEVIMFQLDLNTVPEKFLKLKNEGLNDFFTGILSVKDELLDKFLSNGK